MDKLKDIIKIIRAWCTPADLLLICGIWALAGASAVAMFHGAVDAAEIHVEINGQLAGVYDANTDRSVTMEGAQGPIELHIHDGGVEVVEVGCPWQVCRKTGRISRTGQVLVCVPNRMIVTLSGPPDINAPLITQ
jgi:hypothetical protein